MQKPDTMRLWNDFWSHRFTLAQIALLLFISANLTGQDANSKAVTSVPPIAPTVQAAASSGNPATPQDSTAPTPSVVEKDEAGMFVLHKSVEEVALHATVIDEKDHLITTLDRAAFAVFEDGVQQAITSFRHEDIPVAMAIVIDNSGSMREKREKVNQAALNLVRSSNAQDEVIIVNFNDEEFLDQDFTSDIGKMKEALEKYDARGGTALYDAIDGAADHLKRNGRRDKKVIFVVTDGEDNASRDTLEQAVQSLQQDGGPTVYAIGLLGGEKERRARRALQILAQKTGGIAFFPKTLGEVDQISKTVAHDIRNQYSIGYKPANPKGAGGYRVIRVDAHAAAYRKLSVRTKSGYYATQKPAAQGQ